MAPSTLTGIDEDIVELVRRAQHGDRDAFAQIYDRHVGEIFGFVMNRVRQRETAEDLTGDVFMRAFRRLPDFEWKGVDIGAWIMTIARNRVADHFRSFSTRLERSSDDIRHDVEVRGTDAPERIAEGRELARRLGRALEQLSDEHREVIELRFVHELSLADTAQVIGRTVGATKSLQFRALKALASQVKHVDGLGQLAGASASTLISLLGMLS
ncbi:MAG: sigma-70 family RNA polymerase sigma factor [Nitriliruptorales bacterium]|nr:sigma-70 family RNA polymerase sigma factor [Nitriliruptorales bacterium]